MTIAVRRSVRHQPLPELRHPADHHRRRGDRARRRDPQRPRARRAAYLREHVAPLLIGRDPHRIEDTWQFLYRALVLAARADHDGRDRRGRHGAVGHQGQARRDAGLPAPRRGVPERAARLRPRLRRGPRPRCSTRSASTWSWATKSIRIQTAVPGIKAVYGVAAPGPGLRASATTTSRPAAARSRRRRTGTPAPTCATLPTVFEAVRQRVRPGAAAAARRAPPDHPDPGREAGQGAGTLRPVLARGLHPGREPGGAAAGPPAHHHAAGDRRDLQHRLRLPDPDQGTADRLRPGRVHPLRRDQPAAQGHGLRRAVPDQVRLPRPHRHLPGRVRRAAARGPGDPQLRHPGIHAALGRRPTRSSSSP